MEKKTEEGEEEGIRISEEERERMRGGGKRRNKRIGVKGIKTDGGREESLGELRFMLLLRLVLWKGRFKGE